MSVRFTSINIYIHEQIGEFIHGGNGFIFIAIIVNLKYDRNRTQ